MLLGGAAGLVLLSGLAVAAVPSEPGVPDAPSVPSVSAPRTVTLGTEAEAWYQLTRVSTCSSPIGCLPAALPAPPALPDLPVAPTVFPAGTLHVGWAGGVELARTYLRLDRSALPKGATLVAGTLRVPVIADPTSGTVLADMAGVKACLVTTSFADGVAGALSAAPGIDCSVSSSLNADGSGYSVDLQPFLEAWAAGAPDEGLALTPYASSSVTSAWALAVPGRNAAGLPHVEADLSYVVAQAAAPPAALPAAPVLPEAQPVQAGAPLAPQVVVPAARTRPGATPATLLAVGLSPLGWVAFGALLLAFVVVGVVATQPVAEPR